MLKVLLLDLDGTLARNGAPLPFALEAMAALRRFETAAGDPLEWCLVSDYRMPGDAESGDTVRSITAEFVRMMDALGIGRFFRPISRRVTLSTHAGALKPDRVLFETALDRLGVAKRWTECLVVSADERTVTACRELGMKGLACGEDVTEWPDAVLAIRQAVAPRSDVDTRAALNLSFGATYGAKITGLEGKPTARRAVARVRMPGQRAPKKVTVDFDESGRIRSLHWPPSAVKMADEAQTMMSSLRYHDRVAFGVGPLPPAATHRFEPRTGQLQRERFSAV